MSRRASADEGWKFVKIGDNGHGQRCRFLCGVCRVVWWCEDVGSGAIRWRHVILYWAYGRCTIRNQNVKPAIHFFSRNVVKAAHGESRFFDHLLGVLFGEFTITMIELYDPTNLNISLNLFQSSQSGFLKSYDLNPKFSLSQHRVGNLSMYTDINSI